MVITLLHIRINSNGDKIVDFKYDSIQKIPNTNLVQAVIFNKNTTDLIKDEKVILSMKNAEILIKENFLIISSDSKRMYIKYINKDHVLIDEFIKNNEFLSNPYKHPINDLMEEQNKIYESIKGLKLMEKL